MNSLSSTDLNRMLSAIQHECGIRIREIKLEATQEYNLIKSQIITTKEKQLSISFAKKIKEIEKEREKEESNIIQGFKLKIGAMKEKIINSLTDRLIEMAEESETCLSLIKQIADKIQGDKWFIFCFQKDVEKVNAIFGSKDIKYEIRELPSEALGGIIVCSKDGKEIWDNTFETRISILLEKSLDKISKEIFN